MQDFIYVCMLEPKEDRAPTGIHCDPLFFFFYCQSQGPLNPLRYVWHARKSVSRGEGTFLSSKVDKARNGGKGGAKKEGWGRGKGKGLELLHMGENR